MAVITTLPEPVQRQMTVDEFIALPDDDGVDRMLIRGHLWEKHRNERDRWHSACEAAIAYLLGHWWKSQPRPRGKVLSGGAEFILRGTPGSVVGIDVSYASHEVISHNDIDTDLIDGPPVLAVEILSPNDKQEEVTSKVREYLDVGVALVWVVEPVFQTVTVYRPNERPRLFSGADILSGDPLMPGLQFTVDQIFED